MTNKEIIEGVKSYLLTEHGRDVRHYSDFDSMTNDEQRKMIDELKGLLGEAGRNAAVQTQAVISEKIRQLREVQNSLK